ncbi:MAG: hypothetical protein PVSMB1_14270 [Gemmatimonadaceae bacterium]
MSEDGQLPDGWVWTTLNDLALSVRNGIFISRPGAEPSGTPILRIGSVRSLRLDLEDVRYTGLPADADAIEDSLLHPGDLLFTRYNGNPEFVGCCAVVPPGIGKLTYPDKLIRIVIDERLALPRFVAFACATGLTRDAIRRSVKTTAGQAGISGRELRAVPIPLAPLAEQRRIVEALEDHLSRLDAGERTVKTAIQRLAHLRDSIVAPTNRAKFANHEAAAPVPQSAGVVDGELPLLPASWRWMRLGELADVVGGITKDAKKEADPGFVEVPYLRVANVQRGRIDLTTVTNIRVSEPKASQLALQRGDVLLNEGGDRDKLGRGWIWEDQIEHVIHQNHVFRARIIDKVLDPKLLAWHANGFGRAWFEANGKQSVNLASISLKKIRLFPVPIPPADEQANMVQEIEEQLSVLDNATAAAGQALKKAAGLRRSLLTQAFSGKLVPQDPADEPASELLARIEAERAGLGTRKARSVRPARTTSTRAGAPKGTTTLPSGIQEELPL